MFLNNSRKKMSVKNGVKPDTLGYNKLCFLP